MNQRYTDSVGGRLILIFFATVLLVRVHGQDEATSICAAEGSWKTNMCAKETDFYGNVTCRERLIVLSEEGEEIDVLATIIQLKSELSIVRSQNTELRNRLSHVETTIMPSPPPPSPPPSPPSPPPPIPDASWHAFVQECLAEAPVTGECATWAAGNNYGTMPNWDTSLVTDMSSTFSSRASFDADISKWDISSVTDLGSIFYSASSFNQDIGGWNTEKVTDMESVFNQAEVFDQDISSWDTPQVTTMRSMFHRAYRFNQNIINWDVSLVMDMNGMFGYATMFDQAILSWPSDNINQGYIFYGENMAIHTQIECDSPFWHGPLTSCRYRTTSRFFT
jgi:surface protein